MLQGSISAPNDLINFRKLVKVCEMIYPVLAFYQKAELPDFHLLFKEELYSYLTDLPQNSDEDLYMQSLAIEPRGALYQNIN